MSPKVYFFDISGREESNLRCIQVEKLAGAFNNRENGKYPVVLTSTDVYRVLPGESSFTLRKGRG